jgi:hypothetical protein
MNGLIPKEKKQYLPYTQRTTVSMIYFDASEVFALLNQDAIFLDNAKESFVAPQAFSDIGDIHTGCCYRKTYKAHVKKFGIDMCHGNGQDTHQHGGTEADGAHNNITRSLEPHYAPSQVPCASLDTSITAPPPTSHPVQTLILCSILHKKI